MGVKLGNALKTAINVYLLLILLVLPLYMQEGFVMLGNAKYLFFRNVTLFFIIVTTVILLAAAAGNRGKKRTPMISATDAAALLFGCSAVLSWCFSADRHDAWWGAPGWYMGLLSQLMFVWIYFAVSRWRGEQREVLWAFFIGAVAVMSLGILNRYAFDPLSVFDGLDDWNREHLLSTIGNANWYCGYVSVASAVCIYFAFARDRAQRAAGTVGSLLCFWTIMTQGSEGGYLILLAETAAAFFWSLDGRRKLSAFLGVLTCWPGAALLGQFCIRFRGLILVEDGPLGGLLFWKGWLPALLILAALDVLLYVRERKGRPDRLADGKARKAALRAAVVLSVIGMAVFLACQFWEGAWSLLGKKELLRITDSWGNGRGALWRISMGSYGQMGVLGKLVGAGPDCFGSVIYEMYAVDDIMHTTGQWEGAVYANAHNEWLNMLINQGILGLLSYGGIFAALFVRLWKYRRRNSLALLGILAIGGYCAYGTVSFQQTVSTPLMFAVLGISEGALREEGNYFL